MKILDLFSGIGGFSLGLERAGMQTIAFCEVDPACRQVLKKHWPDVPIFEDVKTLTAKDIHDTVDVICGGFPCQDISLAGKGAGLAGERSGLWYEYRRLIEEIRPRYVIIENVAALRSRGLDAVLSGLTEIGYDAEWHCIPASAVGAPHQRDRIWIVGYPNNNGSSSAQDGQGRVPRDDRSATGAQKLVKPSGSSNTWPGDALADTIFARLEGHAWDGKTGWQPGSDGSISAASVRSGTDGEGWWDIEPDVGRVAHGVPKRVDRLKQLGNAVVPQIPELIGRAILAYENTLA
jgi:DNA (cytosine-5)-methyltransferase 1